MNEIGLFWWSEDKKDEEDEVWKKGGRWDDALGGIGCAEELLTVVGGNADKPGRGISFKTASAGPFGHSLLAHIGCAIKGRRKSKGYNHHTSSSSSNIRMMEERGGGRSWVLGFNSAAIGAWGEQRHGWWVGKIHRSECDNTKSSCNYNVTKKLPIRIRKCRKRSPKVKRTVAVAPSGMEKEEEMESHLQQAILAQKATSAGDTVENHVIPTPKVSTINDDEYSRIYQDRHLPKGKKLITFDDHVPFFLLQGAYNADSEDEEWLTTRRIINIDDFEHIIERLETASQTDIIHLRNARSLLQRYEPGLVDDVYDYWLQKRKQAASRKSKCSVLIPLLCTEQRRDEKTLTRKKQKTELLTYEKMLQLNLALKRWPLWTLSIRCTNCSLRWMEQAERLLVAAAEEGHKTTARYQQPIAAEEPSSSSAFPSLSESPASAIVDSKCIRRNLELWNSTVTVSPLHPVVFPHTGDDSAEMEKISAVNTNSSIDGRYQFKRKHGCKYRAPVLSTLLNANTNNNQREPLQSPFFAGGLHEDGGLNEFRCFSTKFTTQIRRDSDNDVCGGRDPEVGFVRRRLGRGGRIHIDLMRIDRRLPPDDDTK
uniref:Enhancer of polycomb-like protein n=1 Tax=Globodera rostochiensis TaxID=31243 RepID=A0A914IAC8_GLORO